jgi:hypothetical protein
LPKFSELIESNKLRFLRLICDIPPFVTPIDAEMAFPQVYKLVKTHLPVPTTISPKINFTYVECLLYILHNVAFEKPSDIHALYELGKKTEEKESTKNSTTHTNPTSTQNKNKRISLTKNNTDKKNTTTLEISPSALYSDFENTTELREDFKKRLTYLKENTEMYSQKLDLLIADNSSDSAKRDQIQIALRTTKNISLMAQYLLSSPPKFIPRKSPSLILSWNPDTSPKPKKKPVPVPYKDNNGNSVPIELRLSKKKINPRQTPTNIENRLSRPKIHYQSSPTFRSTYPTLSNQQHEKEPENFTITIPNNTMFKRKLERHISLRDQSQSKRPKTDRWSSSGIEENSQIGRKRFFQRQFIGNWK